ncbi:hypothetical protein Tco_0575975 [Tanacetum coccineum]
MLKSSNNHPQGSHHHHIYLHNPLQPSPLHQNHFNPPWGNETASMLMISLSMAVHSYGTNVTKKIYSTALTKLVLRVKKLEYKLKFGKARRKAKIVLSDDEEIAEDSSNKRKELLK